MKNKIVLSVENLHVQIIKNASFAQVVNGVSFQLEAGKVLGIVGESGCGKTITCLSVLGLLSERFRIVEGDIKLKDSSILGITPQEIRSQRGKEIAMIMQNPMSAFNPLITIGRHFVETLLTHTNMTLKEAKELALFSLDQVGLPHPENVFNRHPFELSGGMLQRSMIAIALSLQPSVLIADEPTTALDATVRWQIIGQLDRLRDNFNTGILLVSHDLGVIAHLADEVAVMYCGYIVEMAPVFELFDNPLHPYTRALMASKPGVIRNRLKPIGGQPPSLFDVNHSCPFFDRCYNSKKICSDYRMEPYEYTKNHLVRCINYSINQETMLDELA